MERKSVLRCRSLARSHARRRNPFRSSLFRGRDASLLVVSRPNGQNWLGTEAACDESGQAV
jgi:hypothetical protein